jgi:hypothetical protein
MQMYADKQTQHIILLYCHTILEHRNVMYVFYGSPHKNLTPHLTVNMIVYTCTISKELLLNPLVPELNVCSDLQNLNEAYKTADVTVEHGHF